MARKRQQLGLHTPAEQAQAFDLAQSAFRAAMKAQEDRDDQGYLFARGYLQAVMDLAAVEGADVLAGDILALIERLEV